MNVEITHKVASVLLPYWLVKLCVALLIFSITPANAQDSDFSLLQFSQSNSNEKWLQVISHPSNNDFFFIRTKQNQLLTYKADNNNLAPKLLLDINNAQNLSPTISQAKKLTAFSLHPNFALKEQSGFATFFTAHIESVNKLSKTKRLQDKNTKITYEKDAVITEWQLNFSNLEQVNINSQREILRINIPKTHQGISQLSFNPFIKSWNDNFGLMYIALNAAKLTEPSALYSGVVLRVNPTKFGMQNFSIPTNNPFISNSSIHDAIFLLGAQQIKQIVWPDKNTERILISHLYQPKKFTDTATIQAQWLSIAKGGEDWRTRSPKSVIYNDPKKSISHVMIYQGRNAPSLRSKLLLLLQGANNWQVASLPNPTSVIPADPAIEPQLEWQIAHQASVDDTVSLITNSQDEIAMINHRNGHFYQLMQHNVSTTEQQSSDDNVVLLFLFLLILLGTLAWFYYKNVILKKHSAKALVHRQFAKMALDKNKQNLQLFKRHQKVSEKSIALVNINTCQVFLGDDCIANINRTPPKGLSNADETEIRDIFKKEYTEKMIDDKVRRISVYLIDIEDEHYTVCLYLRKGNDRITKKSYFQVIDELMDWCWLISKEIAASETGSRDKRPTISEAEIALSQHKTHDATPLHKQAAAIRPATHADSNEASNSTSADEQDKMPASPVTQQAKISNEKNSDASSATVDTELVNAIEKLVTLQQQGFLSPDEFSQAKAKLLKNLINES